MYQLQIRTVKMDIIFVNQSNRIDNKLLLIIKYNDNN